MVGRRGVFVVLALLFGFSLVGAFSGSQGQGFGGASNNWQSYQPTFSQLYSGDFSNYWPVLNEMKDGNCKASTDFIIGIPPGGCSPSVVTSDLLAQQNVPVFCKLYAIKVNPLIKVSSISSISFKGNYPPGVQSIVFHPARAAVKSYSTLVGSPSLENIGYVVIILKRNSVERNITKWVEGNLTATMSYDVDDAYGTGKSSYYLKPMSNEEWQRSYAGNSFWNGHGYLRVTDISSGLARVQIMSSKDKIFSSVDLKVGETSSPTYLPGFYCKAGLKVRLDSITTQESMARLNVDGRNIWVRQGDSFLDGQCSVESLQIRANNDGEIKISCWGSGAISPLTLQRAPVRLQESRKTLEYHIGDEFNDKYVVNYGEIGQPVEKFVVLSSSKLSTEDIAKVSDVVAAAGSFDELKTKIGKLGINSLSVSGSKTVVGIGTVLKDASPMNSNFSKSVSIVRKRLVAHYGSEKKDIGGTWGAEALYDEIVLAGKLKNFKSERELMDLFLKEYPLSKNAVYVRNMRANLLGTDYSNSVANVYVGNTFKSISVVDFKAIGEGEKSVELKIGAISKKFVEGQDVQLPKGELTVDKISPGEIKVSFVSDAKGVVSRTIYLKEGNSEVIGGVGVYVGKVNVKEVAQVTLIPSVGQSSSDANFTFKIGIEKRAIQLSPQKTQEMIDNLNVSIAKWQNIVDRLGNVVEGLKGACFATSAILMIKNMASGIGGELAARQKVMDGKYKELCDTKYPDESRNKCYEDLSAKINTDVKAMTAALKSSNDEMKAVQKGNTGDSGGLFGGKGITDSAKYMTDLKTKVGTDSIPVDVGGETVSVPVSELSTPSEIRAVLTWQKAGKGVKDIAKLDMDNALRNVAIGVKENAERKVLADKMKKEWGTSKGVDPEHISILTNKKTVYLRWTGETGSDFGLTGSDAVKKAHAIQAMDGKTYVVVLGDEAGGKMIIKKVLFKGSSKWAPDNAELRILQSKIVFLATGDSKSCSHSWARGKAKISFYSVGKNKGLPAIVPFDLENGWYAMVPNSEGTLIDASPQGYTASGYVKYFKICNVGPNHLMQSGKGDDLCQTFDINTFNSVDSFVPCPDMTSDSLKDLYRRARQAIREVSAGYGKKEISILNQGIFSVGKPMNAVSNFECQDFMSPTDCKLMFNVCDPVICPPSRCDFGGKFPVSDVAQTGIIGSLVLCLPNAREGILMPICLSGVQAGLDGYLSILKSEKSCLSHSLATGQMVGICDQITSIYKCEFFWGQLSPLMDQLVPGVINYAINGNRVRGGGEYASVANSWSVMKQGFSYFKNVYAQNAFRAFNVRSAKEIGSSFCKAFVGTSVPSSSKFINNLLKPESPTQFYAEFSQNLFSGATVPSTSQYKVYYHIYAGKDQGVQYKIYLKNPPATSYYENNPEIDVPTKSGYVSAGKSADESIDFTAPSGYKELCVVINAKEECGFKQVTSNFGLSFLSKKYVAKQAEDNKITTEKECVSGKPSVLSMASLNLQSGAKEVANPNIAMRGIVRVCASTNPSAGVTSGDWVSCIKNADCGTGFNCSSGYCESKSEPGLKETSGSKWQDVGYCGDVKLRCWLDVDSVKGDLQAIQAVSHVPIKALSKRAGLIESMTLNLQGVRALLSKSREEIGGLVIGGDGFSEKALGIVKALNNITGTNEKSGAGTNGNRAEALSLQASVYRLLALGEVRVGVGKVVSPPVISAAKVIKTAATQVQSASAPVTEKTIATLMSSDKDCNCGDYCGEYAGDIFKYSKENNVNPLLVLAVMIQESKCNHSATSGSSYGLMQINGRSFNDICKDYLSSGSDEFVYIETKLGGVSQNIECGVKILKRKYKDYNMGIKGSWAWNKGGVFRSNTQKCINKYHNYGTYTEWDAALRGYNGWGCGSGADVDYVEKVDKIFSKLKSQ